MTISISSDVKTQYLVKMFKIVCLAKNVLAKSIKSIIGLFFLSAHQEVNSKLLLVFLPFFEDVPEFSLI